MSAGNVTNGVSTYSSTIAAASTAETTTFADRYSYAVVTNTSTTATDILYIRADGTAVVAAAEGCLPVMPGQEQIIANGLPLWYQSSNDILKGANQLGNGNTADSPASPGEVTPMESLAVQMANPGTKVSVVGAEGASYTIACM